MPKHPVKLNHTHHPNEYQLESPQYCRRCPGWPQRYALRHDGGGDCGVAQDHFTLVFARHEMPKQSSA